VSSPQQAASRWPSVRRHWIEASDGVAVSAREWGNPAGWPIVFVHGLAQCHLSFLPQLASTLADRYRLIAYDLRGHGESAKPADPAYYQDGRRWADELHAVIAGTGAQRPILVGWSLGGRVLRAYLMHYGDGALGGLHFVSTRPFEDPAVLAAASRADIAGRPEGLAAQIDAQVAFLRACFLRPPGDDDLAVAVAYNALVPQAIREAISAWSTPLAATRDALAQVSVPTLVAHGRDDALILPAAAQMTADAIRGARVSWYDDCGHSPFYEHAGRFNRELDAFAAGIAQRHGHAGRA